MAVLRSRHLRLARVLAFLAAMACAWPWPIAMAADTPIGTYRYTVSNPSFGNIGSFTNTVTRIGDEITVDTQVRIAVRLVFVTLRRIEADRREVWSHGRLISYQSKTTRDGKLIRVNGHAERDKFVIDGVDGRVEASPNVHTSNPWSIGIVGANVVMAAETGKLHDVRFTGGAEETTMVGEKAIPARHYAATGEHQPNLWYDRRDVPVKFSVVDGGRLVTCTLASVSTPSASGSSGRGPPNGRTTDTGA